MTFAEPSRVPAFGAVLAMTGGLAAIVGTILPWANAATATNATGAQLGVDFFDGKIFILMGILAIITSGTRLAAGWLPANFVATVGRLLGTGPWVTILAGGYIVLYGILDLRDLSEQVRQQLGGPASVGPGIYLDVAAGIAILVSGAIAFIARRPRSTEAPHSMQ